ncbi:MAG TPA: OmpA family protein [Gemmatimonadaceae bacterium]|jgi:outer membrane protein OmpA-like peptidoglycan-associated protein
MHHTARWSARRPYLALAFILIFIALLLAGCASLNREPKGAAFGATAGGVIDRDAGNNTGSTTRGAIIGATAGGAAGAIIGEQMDRQAKEIQEQVAGATVERVGEGIQVTFTSGRLYEFDADRLRPEGERNLRNLATTLKRYRDTDLLIVGYTDSVRSDAYNQALSERRARSVSEFLVTQGVVVGRLHSAGRGEMEPLGTNATATGRQANRRVEVAIYASTSYRNELKRRQNTR